MDDWETYALALGIGLVAVLVLAGMQSDTPAVDTSADGSTDDGSDVSTDDGSDVSGDDGSDLFGDTLNVPSITDGVSDVSGSDQDILARTIYGEARGEGASGMQAVGATVRNRVSDSYFGLLSTYTSICKAPEQFSCWNSDDPNLEVIEAVTLDDPTFAQCFDIAGQIISDALADNTGGATFYHSTSQPKPWPPIAWGSVTFTTQIGNQLFYKRGVL